MTVSGLLLFAAVYAAAVASPGPGVALVVARSLGKGLDRVGWFIAGFLVGDYVLFVLAALGLAIVAQTFETAFTVVRLAGAAYLIVIAWKIWRTPVTRVAVDAAAPRDTPVQAFLSSFLLTLGNPKTIVFFLSIMPLAVDLKALDLAMFAELSAVITLVLPMVLGGYALLADRARRMFTSERALRAVNRTTAGIMAGAAVAIAAR